MISIIIPCFNEEDNIELLYKRLVSVLNGTGMEFELIYIDDGSKDESLMRMKNIEEVDNRVKILEFSRNFGHQSAVFAGLEYADGDAVIMMDSDLQHPPELIPKLIEKWKQGFDIVYTVRNDPPEISLFKKMTSKFFYKLINFLAEIHLPANSADFRLFDKKVVLHFRSLTEKSKFLRGLVSWIGFKQCPVSYDAVSRMSGRSKYTLIKMIRFAMDGIISFSAFPLRISTFFGFIVSFASFFYAIYAIYIKLFTNKALPGWTSVLVSVLFLGGIQLLSLGIIGEYLDRIYKETKSRPSYILRNIYGVWNKK